MTRPRLPTALFTVMNGNLPRPSLLPSGMTLTSSSSSQSSSIVLPINRRMIDLNRHFDRLRRRIAFFFCGSLDVVADAAPLVWLTGVGRGRSVSRSGTVLWLDQLILLLLLLSSAAAVADAAHDLQIFRPNRTTLCGCGHGAALPPEGGKAIYNLLLRCRK